MKKAQRGAKMAAKKAEFRRKNDSVQQANQKNAEANKNMRPPFGATGAGAKGTPSENMRPTMGGAKNGKRMKKK